MKVERYDSITAFINPKTKKISILKYLKENGMLYAYSFLLAKENQKKINIIAINGKKISNKLNDVSETLFYNEDLMIDELGIDTTDKYELTYLEDGQEITIDLLDDNYDFSDFYKTHNINENLDFEPIEVEESTSTDNVMLEYACTNVKSLLLILTKMLRSKKDKDFLNNILVNINDINDNYNNINNNLDMLFLSTQVLLLEEKVDYSDKLEELLKQQRELIDFRSNNLQDNNNAILTNNQLDYKKLVKMIRNSIAHSNYKVLEDGTIEFYNDGKNKLNIRIPKDVLQDAFSKALSYYYLEGAFPVIYEGIFNPDNSPFNKNTINDYLSNIEVFNLSNYKIKRFATPEEQQAKDGEMELLLHEINTISNKNLYNKYMDKEEFRQKVNSLIENNLEIEEEPVFTKLTQEDIDYIFNNIQELGDNYFYSLSQSSQIQVINNLIYQRYSKDYYLLKNIHEIINTNHYSNDNLIDKASNYINYKVKIELLIITLLNNLLLFCYNQNKANINVDNISFPMEVYNDYLESKVNLFYDTTREANDYQATYNAMLKGAALHIFEDKDFKDIEESLSIVTNRLIKLKGEIRRVDNIINGNIEEDDLRKVNIEILNRIRDCLAHGRLKIDLGRTNNMLSTKLEIKDEYKGKTKFKTNITVLKLLDTINEPEFLYSILNENRNFQNHKEVL